LFGVTSHWVVLRTAEIGVRVALGAAAGAVMQLVIRQALALALAGVAIGLVAALALNHALGSLLYGVRPADPATLGLAAAVLLAAALLAACLPARRAARVDPMTALRCE
jgi:ABC-type antimicrobial peptide transport system permease subunit